MDQANSASKQRKTKRKKLPRRELLLITGILFLMEMKNADVIHIREIGIVIDWLPIYKTT